MSLTRVMVSLIATSTFETASGPSRMRRNSGRRNGISRRELCLTARSSPAAVPHHSHCVAKLNGTLWRLSRHSSVGRSTPSYILQYFKADCFLEMMLRALLNQTGRPSSKQHSMSPIPRQSCTTTLCLIFARKYETLWHMVHLGRETKRLAFTLVLAPPP